MRAAPLQPRSGFTLIELILVMVILAVVSGAMVPSLTSFRIGRANVNTADQLVALANYARNQAISEGRPYRLNVDPAGGQYWLTAAGDAGVYQPAANDYGDKFDVSTGARLSVQIDPSPNAQMTVPVNVTQTAVQPTPAVVDPNATSGTPNQLMVNSRDPKDGQYVQFGPDGRTDEVVITVTDRTGASIRVGCPSATEQLHVLKPGEMVQ